MSDKFNEADYDVYRNWSTKKIKDQSLAPGSSVVINNKVWTNLSFIDDENVKTMVVSNYPVNVTVNNGNVEYTCDPREGNND